MSDIHGEALRVHDRHEAEGMMRDLELLLRKRRQVDLLCLVDRMMEIEASDWDRRALSSKPPTSDEIESNQMIRLVRAYLEDEQVADV